MNEYHLMIIANDRAAERLAEAASHRLARTRHEETADPRPAPRSRRPSERRGALNWLFGRVAFR
jgi:hypothetical protein